MEVRTSLFGGPRRMGRARRWVREAVVRQREVGISTDAGGADEGANAVGADSRKVDWRRGES